MSISPGSYDITVYQGTTFSRVFTWKDENEDPVDLTGYTARMMARTSIDTSSAFVTLTTENGGISLGDAAGTITATMTATETAALAEQSGVYDLELISGATVIRLLQGNLIVSREVTR